MGCEALQRGAKRVLAIEQNRKTAKVCESNLLSIARNQDRNSSVDVICSEVIKFLKEGSQGLKLAQFVRVMLRRGRQALVNDWTQEANKRRMSGLSLGDRPHFDSDNADVDDDPEIRDEHGNIKGLVDSQGRRTSKRSTICVSSSIP